jgi:hypothetical protein
MRISIKSVVSVAIAASMTTIIIAAIPSTASADNFNDRITKQQQRISNGLGNGSISSREFTNLTNRQTALNTAFLRDTQDGGGLSRSERYKLNRRADNISRSINKFNRN